MIKAVLIDVDNTILDFNKCAYLAMHSVAKDFSITLPKDIENIFHTVNDELWKKIEQGQLTRDELHQIRWEIIFKKCNINADGKKFEKEFINFVWHTAVPVDNAIEILNYLSSKYPIFVASNASAKQQRARLKSVNMYNYFNDIFLSEEIGAEKPSKEFFSYCINKIGFKNNEIVMIGDSLSADISGASEIGINTIWYNHNGVKEPLNATYNYKIDSLLELKNIL